MPQIYLSNRNNTDIIRAGFEPNEFVDAAVRQRLNDLLKPKVTLDGPLQDGPESIVRGADAKARWKGHPTARKR